MNKKNINILATRLLLLATIFMFAACSANETPTSPIDDPIGISLMVNSNMPELRSGSTTTPSATVYAPEGGSIVLFYQMLGSAVHTSYVCDGNTWQSPTPFYWGSLPVMGTSDYQATFFAVAPFVPASINNVPADQSTQEFLTAADLLVGSTTVERGTPSIDFLLNHQLALVEVRLLTESNEASTAGDITAAKVTMDGLLTDYSAITTADAYSITARGEVTSGLKTCAIDVSTHHFIAPAQSLSSIVFNIEVDHVEFHKAYGFTYNGNVELKPSMKTVFSLTLKEGKVIAISVELAEWNEKTGSGNLIPEFNN